MGAVEEALHLSMEKTQHLLLLPYLRFAPAFKSNIGALVIRLGFRGFGAHSTITKTRNPLKIVWVILSAPIVASWVLQRLQAEGLVRQSRTILRGWVGNLEPFGLLDC